MLRRPSLLALALVLPAACSSDTGAPNCGAPGARCGPEDAGDTAGTDGSTEPPRDGGPDGARALTAITLDPPQLELTSRDGDQPEARFSVLGRYSDGSEAPVTFGARFSFEPLLVGHVAQTTGQFRASGRVGGAGTLRVEVASTSGTLSAEASVRVHLERTLLGPGTDASTPGRFASPSAADPARAAGLVYPLDGVVMPQNVYPAHFQWERGAPGDLFRVRLEKPSITLTAYVAHTGQGFGNDWLPEESAWRSLAQTDPEAPVTVRLDRLEAASGEVVEDPPITLRFVEAALSGSIYYWDISAVRIVRIDDGTARREAFMPSPPLGCVGCHSVSRSGRYMAGRFGGDDNIGGTFDLTRDLTGNPPPTLFPVNQGSIRWWFSSWSPDDRRLIASTQESSTPRLRLVDPFAGTYLEPGGHPLPAGTHPEWSPDGTTIAFTANNDWWGGGNTTGDITLIPVTGPDTFGEPLRIHEGAAMPGAIPEGNADSYPTWSPDSQWIAFAHGTSSRSENGAAALYLMRRDGSGLMRLSRASGGPTARDTFQPKFSPFTQGGYFWLSYLSRRPYGNAERGTAGSHRPQVWISAVRINPAPGEDPSEVGYWLPGQDTRSANISAFWAPRACRADGEACTVASECCGGDCRPDEAGALVCSPALPACGELGAACVDNGDCCDLPCVAGSCGAL